MSIRIAPSVLAADFANLQRDVEMINQSQADWIHVDIMDGMFVPNISFGLPVCEAIHRHAKKPLDVHLMIEEPDRYLEAFKKAGAHVVTVHYEACKHLHRTVQHIKSLGCQAGVALNPHTPAHVLEELISEIDLVCLMSVNPGYGGQSFIQSSYEKTKRLKSLINLHQSDALIEIDGGVDTSNAAALANAGADVLVAGSAVFKSKEPIETIAQLKNIV